MGNRKNPIKQHYNLNYNLKFSRKPPKSRPKIFKLIHVLCWTSLKLLLLPKFVVDLILLELCRLLFSLYRSDGAIEAERLNLGDSNRTRFDVYCPKSSSVTELLLERAE